MDRLYLIGALCCGIVTLVILGWYTLTILQKVYRSLVLEITEKVRKTHRDLAYDMLVDEPNGVNLPVGHKLFAKQHNQIVDTILDSSIICNNPSGSVNTFLRNISYLTSTEFNITAPLLVIIDAKKDVGLLWTTALKSLIFGISDGSMQFVDKLLGIDLIHQCSQVRGTSCIRLIFTTTLVPKNTVTSGWEYSTLSTHVNTTRGDNFDIYVCASKSDIASVLGRHQLEQMSGGSVMSGDSLKDMVSPYHARKQSRPTH